MLSITILAVDGNSVSSKADVKYELQTTSKSEVLVTWWQYDPRVRGWYTGAVERAQEVMSNIDWTTEVTKGVNFGAPYQSATDAVWLITASKAVFVQKNCDGGAPECSTILQSADLLGVCSFDMNIPVLNSITSKIKSRVSGDAHLFHVESGLVVSSPQWKADSTSTEMKMANVFINTVTFGNKPVEVVKNADDGHLTYDGSVFS